MIDEHLRSENAATRRGAVEALEELLEGDSADAQSKRVSCFTLSEFGVDKLIVQELVLKENALIFIPSLLPILVDAPSPVKRMLEHIASTSRPKEVVLALNESLQTIEERIESLQYKDLSDDEDEEVLMHEGKKYEDLVQDILALVLRTYAQGQSTQSSSAR